MCLISLSLQKRTATNSIVVGFIVMTIEGYVTKLRGMIKKGRNGLWADFSNSDAVNSRRNPGTVLYLSNIELEHDLQQQCNAVVREFWDREEDHIVMKHEGNGWIITDIGRVATSNHKTLKYAANLQKAAMIAHSKSKSATKKTAKEREEAADTM